MFIFNKMGRQLTVQFWIYCLSGLLVFVSLFLTADFLGNGNQYEGVSRGELLTFYYYMLPEVVYRMLPVAALIGVIFALAQIQRTNELLALFSLGISLWQVTSVLLLSVLLTAVFNFYLGDQVVPQAIQNKNYLYYHQIKKKPGLYSTVKTGKIWYKVKDTIFYLQTLNPESSRAEGLKMFLISPEWKLLQLIEARQVIMEGQIWKLKEGLVTLFSNENHFPMTETFKEKTIVMEEEAAQLAETAKPSEVLKVNELKRFIDRNREAGLDTRRYEVDYYSKWSFVFAGLIMSLMAIPFLISKGRSGGIMGSIGVVLGLVFIFWTFYSSSLALGYHGRLSPLLAAWSSNVILFVAGLYFIQKTGR